MGGRLEGEGGGESESWEAQKAPEGRQGGAIAQQKSSFIHALTHVANTYRDPAVSRASGRLGPQGDGGASLPLDQGSLYVHW